MTALSALSNDGCTALGGHSSGAATASPFDWWHPDDENGLGTLRLLEVCQVWYVKSFFDVLAKSYLLCHRYTKFFSFTAVTRVTRRFSLSKYATVRRKAANRSSEQWTKPYDRCSMSDHPTTILLKLCHVASPEVLLQWSRCINVWAVKPGRQLERWSCKLAPGGPLLKFSSGLRNCFAQTWMPCSVLIVALPRAMWPTWNLLCFG